MSPSSVANWLLALSVVLVLLAPVAAATSHDASVEAVSYTGEGRVGTPLDGLFLWKTGPHAFDAVITTGNASGTFDVCLLSRLPDPSDPAELACQVTTVDAGGQATVTFEFDRWPANLTGRQNVSVVVTDPDASTAEPLATETIGVTVLEPAGDPDGDGLVNELEASEGTDFFVADTDGDRLRDGPEVETYGTDPTKADADGDGLTDGEEANVHETDPLVADTDDDGLTDDLEVRTHGTNPNRADTDGDDLSDAAEVNIYGTDPLVADTDEDGLGDVAEVNTHGTNPNLADTDEDGLDDGEEVTVYATSPSKSDTDGDGIADWVEVSTHQTDPTDADTDGDGLDDDAEVNTYGTNPNRADTDGDRRSDGEEVSGGTDPRSPDATPGPIESLGQSRGVVGAFLLATGAALLAVFVLVHRSGGLPAVARRLRVVTALGGERETGRAGPGGATGPDALHPPFPTNRARVFELLEAHGGRMLQSDIVEQTDWSKSKVSRVLSDMDADGEIAKIDVGKGNLIALPEVTPPGSRPRSDRDDE